MNFLQRTCSVMTITEGERFPRGHEAHGKQPIESPRMWPLGVSDEDADRVRCDFEV